MSTALSKVESSLALNVVSSSFTDNDDNRYQKSSDPNAIPVRMHLTWEKTQPAGVQTFKLCCLLAKSGKLYKTSTGQLVELVPGMPPRHIRTHVDLEAFIRENMDVTFNIGGRPKGNAVPASDLKVMMHSERFLTLIPVVDRIVSMPTYNSRWCLTKPGYNDGGTGNRFFMYGNALEPKLDPEYIRAFLDAMPFKSPGDKTNALAFALTVKLRHMWPGQKPFFPVTANKSHVGKDTIIDFASGLTRKEEISYHDKDWATQNEAVNVLIDYDVGLLSIGNIRTKNIQSAYVERTITSSKVFLQSSKRSSAAHRESDFVVCASAKVTCRRLLK